MKKNEDLLHLEVELRHALKEAKMRELSINQDKEEEEAFNMKKTIELEVELEDIKI